MECDPSIPDFTECLRQIVSGTPDEVRQGWINLRQLDEEVREDIDFRDVMGVIRMPIRRTITNVDEIPKLLVYFSTLLKRNPFEGKPADNNYTAFLQNTAGNDISLLAVIVKVLDEHDSIYLPTYASNSQFCEAIVTCLAEIQMPTQRDKVSKFKDSSLTIQNYVKTSCDRFEGLHKDSLRVKCLEKLYNIIQDLERKSLPGAALVNVLTLIEGPESIQQAVQWIISNPQNDDNLERALKTLCTWLSQWLKHDCLSLWISAFIQGLEDKKKYSVLNRVAEDCLKMTIKRLHMPMAHQHGMALVFRLLGKQSTPALFHRVIKDIEQALMSLSKDSTDIGRKTTQSLVDCCKALMMRFPSYPIYETLEKSLPVEPRMEIVNRILNAPLWEEETRDEMQNIFFINNGKVGLTNLGNTCYMNSVLQALVMTRQFCHEVISYKPPVDTNANLILRKLQNLFALLLYSKRMSLSPTEVLQASRPSYFTPGQQQDSSEFLCHLLDVMYEQEKSHPPQSDDLEMKILKSTPEEQDVEDMNVDSEGCGIKRWITEEDLTEGTTLERKTQSLADFSDGDDLAQTPQLSDSHSDSTDSGIQSVGGEDSSTPNLVHRVFGGESKITYQCAQCDTSSHNTDKFRDLQLCFPEEIPENQEVSVQDLINYYLIPENLTGDNKYRCDKCMKLCDAQRIIKHLRAPAHLILTLKHFHYDTESRLRTKLRHKVRYNEKIKLEVSTPMSIETETYQLYAAVVHSGYSMDYGHYFTYARDSKQNWYKFNDSYVSKTTLDEFKGLEPPDTPYILFYEKVTKTDGLYEDDKPELANLSKHIQDLVERDTAAYNEEMRKQAEKKKNQRGRHISLLRRNDNSDDENPPPSSCRGAIDIPTNHFLY
ncbi:ubiquitin carboxyl-terminal hydrolase 35 [Diachasma alloeum]|uniref:ubiquitin carboxyl-terminal hydrolase 35 n=1 Tax=Diachasma alloeum TaxID=454923 RepID=UPI000738421F|nr:ubiquitin carboxyl-terminal hydrolase 35 [Diachasma alloeum]